MKKTIINALFVSTILILFNSCCSKVLILCATNDNLKLYIEKSTYATFSFEAKNAFKIKYKNFENSIYFEDIYNGTNGFSYEIGKIDSLKNIKIILSNSVLNIKDTIYLYSFNIEKRILDQSCGFNKDIRTCVEISKIEYIINRDTVVNKNNILISII